MNKLLKSGTGKKIKDAWGRHGGIAGFTYADYELVLRMLKKAWWTAKSEFLKFMFSKQLIESVKHPNG